MNLKNRVFEFEMIDDEMMDIISKYSPKIKIAQKYKNLKVFDEMDFKKEKIRKKNKKIEEDDDR